MHALKLALNKSTRTSHDEQGTNKLRLQWTQGGIFTESVRKYRCLYDKSCADYKNKVFVENAWAAVDKEMGFEEGKEFSYFLCRMKFKRRTRKIFY